MATDAIAGSRAARAGGRVFLDWNAGAPLRAEARATLVAALEIGGNPSSVHGEGREARRVVETARRRVGALVGIEADRVVFTSGGTEANVTALSPAHRLGGRPAGVTRLLHSAVEHPSVMAGGRFKAENRNTIGVDAQGRLDLQALTAAVAQETAAGGRVLLSLMHANNETGAIQPVAEAAAIVHDAGGLVHVDMVQSAGRLQTDAAALGADLVSLSAHKIGGPKGIGALGLVRPDLDPDPLLTGGGQEFRRRAGTESVPLIAGFGAAAEAAITDRAQNDRLSTMRDWLQEQLILICGETVVFSRQADRLAGTLCFAVPGVAAERAIIALDLAGIAVSSGSACSSGKVAPSHVLKAMGVADDLAKGAIRVSLGPSTEEADIGRFAQVWADVLERFLGRSGARRGNWRSS